MIRLDYRDSRPIYQQVKDGLRRLVVTGVLAQGDQIPSVRQLATQLAINPNTIARAYAELEAEGFIYSVGGKGTFVAESGGESGAARRRDLASRAAELIRELRALGMTQQEWTQLWEGGQADAYNEKSGQDL